MAYTEEEKQKILSVLQEKGVGNLCPLCRKGSWILPDGIVTPVLQEKLPDIQVTGTYFPNYPLVCVNCGNTVLINLNAIGLTDMIPKKKKD